jgi:hypothetical protein
MARKWFVLLLGVVAAGLYFTFRIPESDPAHDPNLGKHAEKSVQSAQPILAGTELFRQNLLATLTLFPGHAFPANLPWEPLRDLGQRGAVPLDHYVRHYPLQFLQMCLDRHRNEVKGYNMIFHKQERLAGKLQKVEKLKVHFREQPFSVHMEWLEGARLASKTLYVAGDNNGHLLARPHGALLGLVVISEAVDSEKAKASGRYPINEFGLYKALQRTLASMKKAESQHTLHLSYEGVVELPETGNRPCYKFVRTGYSPPEEDGIHHFTLYIDQQTWLQVGSILKDANGDILAEYFFRDIELNPTFSPKQFTRGSL